MRVFSYSLLLVAALIVVPEMSWACSMEDDGWEPCDATETRCLGREYFCSSRCSLLVYENRPVLFGLIDRWYVYSRAGGRTTSLKEFFALISTDSTIANMRFSTKTDLLRSIGEPILNECHVDSFWDCHSGNAGLDANTCKARTVTQIGEWKHRIGLTEVASEE